VENTSQAVPPQVSEGAVQLTFNLDWNAVETLEARHVNQVMMQLGSPGTDGIPDGVYLGIGVVTPPVLQAPTADAVRDLAERMRGADIPVTVYGRFHMSRATLDVVIKTLQRSAEMYDAVMAQTEQAKAQGQE
jgi:hypothetical protein